MSYIEVLEEMIDDLVDKQPYLTPRETQTLIFYYELLAKEWRDRHVDDPTYPDFDEGTGLRGGTPRK